MAGCIAKPIPLVFGTDPNDKWKNALARLGIGPSGLTANTGRA